MSRSPISPPVRDLLERFEGGQRLALARAITLVENEAPGFQEFLHDALSRPPSARRIGLTGPPGAGKSTLVASLVAEYRRGDEEVGVVAVDPTSPYSGGALLGDRIRMNDIALDRGVFIRSMATRGSLGGLATTTKEVVDVMDAFGFPRLLLETVGVGQTELEITSAADTVVVILVPESGDGVQAMKAGLMEIADVFVINKADRPGADRLLKEVRVALNLRGGHAATDVPAHHGVDYSKVRRRELSGDPSPDHGAPWKIPVLKTVAQDGEGLPELMEALEGHRAWLEESGELERRRRARAAIRVKDVVDRAFRRIAWSDPDVAQVLEGSLADVAGGEETPYSVGDRILEILMNPSRRSG
jgi:LAO/AO transport system kinase